ncbi:hypothetical protein [Paenibacillus polymyxa]|uniref:Pectate lyase superfamily protein domain-containing protein n=1 Tax=Paenibacillus polymyxa TaxID=1406 RepID=A0AAP4A0A1_PAEPO|nr:hypothetical protein [Paenibacillus polymyxa]MDH2332518.1 hypothetical protein [Paenibacillus polymyxa]
MASEKTPNLGLNQIDRTSPTTTYFDLEKYLDENWRAVDAFAGTTQGKLDKVTRFVVTSDMYGANGDGTDQTQAIQNALNYLESVGGGKLILGAGTFLLSLAKSTHSKACIVIPAGVTIEGSGMGVTILKRLESERTQDGILLVNKNYDTKGGYTAAGNITLRNFTITDGTVTATPRTYGDLIALGHADNVLIERVESLNHDQHFVDICGSRNVTIRDCVCNNLQDTYGTATIQVDRAKNLGIWGLLLDDTNPEEVAISDNKITSLSDMVLQLGHDASTVKDISVVGNIIVCANTNKGQIAIGNDDDTSISTADVEDNQIELNNINSAGIYLVGDPTNKFENISIASNIITGKMRSAVFVGSSTMPSSFANFRNVLITNNTVDMDIKESVSTHYISAIRVSNGVSASIVNNTVRFACQGGNYAEAKIIRADSFKDILISTNQVIMSDSNSRQDAQLYGIQIEMDSAIANSLYCKAKVIGNMVLGTGYRWGISERGGVNVSNFLQATVSGNNVYDDAPTQGHYHESTPSLDGTNNVQYVNFESLGFPATGPVLTVQAAKTYTFVSPIRKSGITPTAYVIKGDFIFNPVSATSFNTDTEEVRGAYWVEGSTAKVVGISLSKTVLGNDANGRVTNTITINTGANGCNLAIDPTNHAGVIRSNGYLMLRIGV